jgi:predicted transcriptional regulator
VKERECLHLLSAEENFLKQMSRVKWLNLRDGNTAFFHNSVKARNSSNLIKMVKDEHGHSYHEFSEIKRLAISFYKNLLGHSSHVFTLEKVERVANLIKKKFSVGCVAKMEAPVTRVEIKDVVFSMNPSMALGPDGFSAGFYQKAWAVVGDDLCEAIMEFFSFGKLLKETNAIILTLIPKKKNASYMSEYRPIACCNVVYKCITKILTNRLIQGLDEMISSNQGAFIPKRGIAENILLAQEVVCDYHKTNGVPRCTLKVDLMKAYDSLDWEYVLHCLKCSVTPSKFIYWIRACITSPSFTIALNGTLVGFFQGKKGLRQGDPISPYLFVLAMEGLTLLMEEAATSPHFGYHPKCAAVNLTHLCFVDDLLVFLAAFTSSVTTIIGALAEFEHISGLKANPSKSSIFLVGAAEDVKQSILNILHMPEGTLPVRYLGVPLITKRLTAIDCEALVNKITTRVDSWLAKKLTFAGRLQLISSVLLSMQIFWAKVFILPKKVVRLIEQKLNRFLWSGRDTKAHAKVAWSQLCVPKQEGGLGIKRIEVWNKASMLNHIWNLFTKAGSLLVAWINANMLKGRCLWEISIPNSCSWSRKKLLKLHDIAKPFISLKVGNGSRVFLWFDHWHPAGYLLETFGHRIVHDLGFPLRSKLEVAIKNGEWNWPPARSDALVVIQSKLFEVGIGDTNLAVWNAKNGQYTCADVWDKLREVHRTVGWWKLVWFPSFP